MLSFSKFINNLSRANKLVLCGLVSVGLSVMSFSNLSHAANDGLIGQTSQGTIDISVQIPSLTKITALPDFNFGEYTGGGIDVNSDVCIFTNIASGAYTITADDGHNNPTYFYFFHTTENLGLVYTPSWNFGTGTVGAQALVKNVALAGTAVNEGIDCASGKNANLSIVIDEADIDPSVSGSYAGTLTITVAVQ